MFAQCRRRRPDLGLAPTVLDGRADQLDRTAGRMFDLADHAAGSDMLVVQGILDIVDGGVGHAGALENLEPLFRRLRLGDGLDHGFQLVAVLDAAVVGDEAFVSLPLGLSQLIADDAEEAVVATTEHDVAVRRLEAFVRHDARVSRAPAPTIALSADEHAARDVR